MSSVPHPVPSASPVQTESPLAPLYRQLNAHLAYVAGEPPLEGARVLAKFYVGRLTAVGCSGPALGRVERVAALLDAVEQHFLMAWYLAERDVGLAPGGDSSRVRHRTAYA